MSINKCKICDENETEPNSVYCKECRQMLINDAKDFVEYAKKHGIKGAKVIIPNEGIEVE